MPKISVIMLTFNRENLIERAIKSILCQTFTDFEYIIVDNGSTDASGIIADRYANSDDRIKVLHINKSNIGTGRNAGLAASTGDYIAFIDDDDIAYCDMLEFLYNLCICNNADISFCGSHKESDGKLLPNCCFEEMHVFTPEQAVTELLKRKNCNAAMPTKMVSRKIFKNLKFPANGKYDDITTTYKIFAFAKKIAAHGLPKYCFSRHAGNNSAFTTNDLLLTPGQLNEYFKAFRERTVYLSAVLPEIADFALYSEWSYMISMCNKITKNNLQNCHEQLLYVTNVLKQNYDEFYNSPYTQDFEKQWLQMYILKERI